MKNNFIVFGKEEDIIKLNDNIIGLTSEEKEINKKQWSEFIHLLNKVKYCMKKFVEKRCDINIIK